MPEKNQSCINCYYFLKTGENEEGQIGYCRCNPPHAYWDPKTGKPTVGRFPIVVSGIWCGMWEEADNARQENGKARGK